MIAIKKMRIYSSASIEAKPMQSDGGEVKKVIRRRQALVATLPQSPLKAQSKPPFLAQICSDRNERRGICANI